MTSRSAITIDAATPTIRGATVTNVEPEQVQPFVPPQVASLDTVLPVEGVTDPGLEGVLPVGGVLAAGVGVGLVDEDTTTGDGAAWGTVTES